MLSHKLFTEIPTLVDEQRPENVHRSVPLKTDSVLMNYIINQIYHSPKNVIIVVVGQPGTGKSNTGVKLMYELNPELKTRDADEVMNERVAFNSDRFMEILQDGRLHKGDVVIWDEPQVGLNSRDAMTKYNKLINSVLTTFRHRQLVTIFCTPSLSYIDSAARKVISLFISMGDMNVQQGWSNIKVYQFKYNALADEYVPMRIRFMDGRDHTLKEYAGGRVYRLPPNVEAAYKKHSVSWKTEIVSSVKSKLNKELAEAKVKPVLANIERELLSLKFDKHMDKDEIVDHTGLQKGEVTRIFKDLKRRGIKITKPMWEQIK
jgi:ABC-type multidrug transport system ATPase subunit